MQTNTLRAFTYVFDSPKWMPNLLWLTLAALTQNMVVGTIFLLGYGTELIRTRAGRSGTPAPDIDIDQLGDYITKGIVPILVYLVFALPFTLVISVPLVIMTLAFASIAESSGGEMAGGLLVAIMGGTFLLVMGISLILALAVVPLMIRSMITQHFRSAFDFGWCWQFIKRMYVEIILGALLYMGLSIVVSLLGMLAFCVGVLPAAGLCSAAAMHLLAQWYEIYLDGGGEPVAKWEGDIVTAEVI